MEGIHPSSVEKHPMNILGVKIVGHDTGAALISEGRIVAIAEERSNRAKRPPYIFPKLAVDLLP